MHWNTVARAYRRLADEGLLKVRRGRGAIVSDQRRTSLRLARTSVRERMTEAISAGLVGGMSRDDIAGLFKEALAVFSDRKR